MPNPAPNTHAAQYRANSRTRAMLAPMRLAAACRDAAQAIDHAEPVRRIGAGVVPIDPYMLRRECIAILRDALAQLGGMPACECEARPLMGKPGQGQGR